MRFMLDRSRQFGCALAAGDLTGLSPTQMLPALVAAFLLILVAGSGSACAQEFLVRNWQTEDGLADNTVTAIQQTTDGYLWLGTFNGLVRFDGVQLKTYDAANTPALRSSQILSLLVDPAGVLWIGTEGGGLVRLAGGRFQSVSLTGYGAFESISALFGDRNGALWFLVTGKGVGRLQKGNVQTFTEADLEASKLPALSDDPAVQAWLSARNDRLTFRAGSWFWRPAQVPSIGSEVIALQRSRNGSVWLAFHRRLVRLPDPVAAIAGASYPWVQESSSAIVTTVAEDRDGRLWVGTGNGLYRSTKLGEYTQVKREGPLFQNLISTIFEDREGLIWVGTYRGGLFRIKPRTVTALSLPGAGDSLVLSACAARDGSVWLGTGGGAGLYRYAEGKLTRYGEAEGLTNMMVCTVFEDRHTNLWAGTWGGLFRLENGRFQRANPSINLPERVLALYEDRAGDLWVGGYGGLARKRADQWTLYTQRDGLSHPDVRVMAEDGTGSLWVGTAGGGLDRLRGGRFTHFGEADGFPQKMLVALVADNENTLWIGTIAGGLFRFKDGKFTAYTTEDGLADNVVGGIVEDTQDNLWLSSQNGILRVNKRVLNQYQAGVSPPLPCLSLSVGDGLTTQTCSGSGQPVVARTADGRLWIPNMKAVAVVDPHSVPPHTAAPTVLVEELSIDGRGYALDRDPSVRVSFGRSRFEFHYTVLGLPLAEAARFRHKLEGLDRDWVNAGVRRVAYYSQLPPGQYQFRVMATGNDGFWHEAPVPLVLQIVPHFWELRWFQILLSVGLVTAVLGAFFLIERRKLRLRLEHIRRQKALETERGRIARDIHDDLGASLTQIMLVSELGQKLSRQPDEAAIDFAKIAHKTRQAVQALDEIVWAVNPKNDNLPRLVRYICRFTDECFEASGIRCWQKVSDDLPTLPLRAELRHNLFLAVKESLNNVLKHSHATEVWLRIAFAEQTLRVEVEDNGCGFALPPGDSARSGLRNMKTRLEEIGGLVDIQSAPQSGTCVRFVLPLKHAAATESPP